MSRNVFRLLALAVAIWMAIRAQARVEAQRAAEQAAEQRAVPQQQVPGAQHATGQAVPGAPD